MGGRCNCSTSSVIAAFLGAGHLVFLIPIQTFSEQAVLQGEVAKNLLKDGELRRRYLTAREQSTTMHRGQMTFTAARDQDVDCARVIP